MSHVGSSHVLAASSKHAARLALKTLATLLTGIALAACDSLNLAQVEAGAPRANPRPNIVIINVDDLGYGDISSYGAENVRTPNIDRLAEEGAMFTDAHAASAVCSPSRYALITGEYPFRNDFWLPVFATSPLVIDTSKTTIASLLKEEGYSTAAIGKWHLGFGDVDPVDWNGELAPGPLELGFDYYFGVPVLNSHPPFVYVENRHVLGLTEDDPLVYGKTAQTREFDEKFDYNEIGGGEAAHALYEDRKVGTLLTEKAIEWVRARKSEPFFLYFATTNIHHPFTPAPQFIGTSGAGRYGDFIHELDWMIGELLAALDEEGLADNTLVLFISDNGAMFNRGGQTAWEAGHRPNGDLLGVKFGAWEGGHRVPFIARWPGHISGGVKSSALVSNVDFMATLADLVGHPLNPTEASDSVSFLPVLLGRESGGRDQLVMSAARRDFLAIRKGKWVYLDGQGEGGFGGTRVGQHTFAGPAAAAFMGRQNSDIVDGRIRNDAPPGQLYDLEADPRQTENLYNERPEIVKMMQEQLRAEKAVD
jgi:arylsulfatase A